MLTRRTALALPALLSSASASADTFPTRPVRFIVPYPPGGITDLLARRLGEKLSQAWGQSVVIENRAGAGGNIAAVVAARSAPDGHTIFMGFLGTHAANAALYPELGYDPVRDFTPVGLVAAAPMVLTVNPEVPARNVAEFVAHARANPGRLTFGSSGNGGASHLALELFKMLNGLDIVHVPYRGTAPLTTDLLAGRISGYFDVPITAKPNVEAGKVRALAVGFERRSSALPDVPTFAEAGMPDYAFSTWLGVLAPAGLPAPILARMSQDLMAAVRSADFIEWCQGRGLETMPSTPDEFARFMAAETQKFARLIRAAAIRLE